MKPTPKIIHLAFILLLSLILILHCTPQVYAVGSTFVVDSDEDQNDSNLTDGQCLTGLGTCTLRAAIQQTNHDALTIDTITFDIENPLAIDTLITTSYLPEITTTMTIQGPNLHNGKGIVINGGGASGDGLIITADNVIIRDIKIRNFGHQGISIRGADHVSIENCVLGSTIRSGLTPGNKFRGILILNATTSSLLNNIISGNGGSGIGNEGILIEGGGSHIIQGNIIGLDYTGTDFNPNVGMGISISESNNNLIGGSTPETRNLISGNGGNGIFISGGTGNTMIGNYIGTNATGTLAIPNGGDGIQLYITANAVVGGTNPGEGNLISGNGSAGIRASGSGTVIMGNVIGLNSSQTNALPNEMGIILFSDYPTTIGGTGEGEMNVIAGNTGDGVRIVPSARLKQIIGNAIYNNGGLGINLLETFPEDVSYVTPNDEGDGDTGANDLQNYSTLTNYHRIDSSNFVISGTLNSLPSSTYTLHFYGNEHCDPSGFGEGQVYLGYLNVTTDSSNEGSFTKTFTTPPEYACITATATDSVGNTSEFSRGISEGYSIYLPLIVK